MTEIVASNKMAGLSVGLYFRSHGTVYVSKAVKVLCDDNLDLMKKHLKVFEAPEECGTVEDLIAFLIEQGQDIFTKQTKDEIGLFGKKDHG
jgi:hypothetical protein